MGLGKTVQAIATAEHTGAFPALVICPASLKFNWKKEIKAWTGETGECDNVPDS
jgi:SWI/SNF-related matrix-associated actin-dependent regulator 1 of chromatin subfamily A